MRIWTRRAALNSFSDCLISACSLVLSASLFSSYSRALLLFPHHTLCALSLSLSLSCPRPPASPWLTSSQNLVAPIPSVLLLQFPLFSFWHRVRQTEIGMPVTIFFDWFFSAGLPPGLHSLQIRIGVTVQGPPYRMQYARDSRGWEGLGVGVGVGVDAALIPALSSSSVPAVSRLYPPGTNDWYLKNREWKIWKLDHSL